MHGRVPQWALTFRLAILPSGISLSGFSSSRLTGTDCQNRLAPQTFEALQLLKHAYCTSTLSVDDEIKNWDSEDDKA